MRFKRNLSLISGSMPNALKYMKTDGIEATPGVSSSLCTYS
jgi:hypothetical protein